EPVGAQLRAHRLGVQTLVILLLEAKAVQADLKAVVVAHAADAALSERGREAVLEVRDDDGLLSGDDLAELAGPQVANAELVFQKRGDGVTGPGRIGRGILAEQGQHLSAG